MFLENYVTVFKVDFVLIVNIITEVIRKGIYKFY